MLNILALIVLVVFAASNPCSTFKIVVRILFLTVVAWCSLWSVGYFR